MYPAASHCLTAHIKINSGTSNVQSINLILFKDICKTDSFGGGILGCIVVQVQRNRVKRQLQTTSNVDLLDGSTVTSTGDGDDDSKFEGPIGTETAKLPRKTIAGSKENIFASDDSVLCDISHRQESEPNHGCPSIIEQYCARHLLGRVNYRGSADVIEIHLCSTELINRGHSRFHFCITPFIWIVFKCIAEHSTRFNKESRLL